MTLTVLQVLKPFSVYNVLSNNIRLIYFFFLKNDYFPFRFRYAKELWIYVVENRK